MNEVDLDSQVIHLKSLAMPSSSKKGSDSAAVAAAASNVPSSESNLPETAPETSDKAQTEESRDAVLENVSENVSEPLQTEADTQESIPPEDELWPERFTASLQPFLSEAAINQVKSLFLEGPEPPLTFVSDSGWAGRQTKTGDGGDTADSATTLPQEPAESETKGRGKRGRDRGRGGRGGRGGGRSGRPGTREDTRKVLSDVGVHMFYDVTRIYLMCVK